MRWLTACAVLSALAVAYEARASDPVELALVAFEGSEPVEGLELWIDDARAATTGPDGGLAISVVPGRRGVRLLLDAREIARLSVRVAESPVQILVDVRPGPPQIDIEGAEAAAGSSDRAAEDDAVGHDAARESTLSGRVVSAKDGEPIAHARVYVAGRRGSGASDADGRYEVEVAAGTHDVAVVHPHFETHTRHVRVAPGRTRSVDFELTPVGIALADFVVSEPYVRGSVASVQSRMREASSVVDILGAEEMSRAGDSTAADALQRVTGLTIEDGKFVVIRGAPARYTQTLWNGSPLPSPDPIKRIVPLDMFPTGVLSNVGAHKSYDAAQPGSFGAGLIALETASIPDESFVEAYVKTGGNSQSTGGGGFDHAGGAADFLGADDGTRGLGEVLGGALGGGRERRGDLEPGARDLPNIWEVRDRTLPPDVSVGVSAGRREPGILGGDFGMRGSLSWGHKYRHTEALDRTYALRGNGALALRDDKTKARTDMKADLGGLVGAQLGWKDHTLASNTFFIRKTQQRTEITEGFDATSDDRFGRDFMLEWNERELLAQQLLGAHELGRASVSWRAMLAQSRRDAPDRRDYSYLRQPDGEFVFFRQAGAGRRWNQSEDDVGSAAIDARVPLARTRRLQLHLETGLSATGQRRDSQTRRLGINIEPGADLSAAPEELLAPANIGETLTIRDDTQTNDHYTGEALTAAGYLKGELSWADTVRVIAGARLERSSFEVRTFIAGGSQGGQQVGGSFAHTGVLPSLAAIWSFADDMQLRASYGRTLSHPVLNELSPARYFDPDTGQEYRGNEELLPAAIDSVDARWEWHPSAREALSVGVFGKRYEHPIEETFTGVGGSTPIRTVQNAEGATVGGVELSARAQASRLTDRFGLGGDLADRLYVQANAAFITSEVSLARQDLATSAERPLQGQAGQVYNLQLGYDGARHDWTLSLNHVGKRLRVAGRQGQPDVYEQPVTLADLKYSYAWSESMKLEVTGGNLLNQAVELRQGNEPYERVFPGVELSMAIKYGF